MNSYCSFCASAGIKGPHDHFLRASRAQGAAVVCPKLLSTECKFCHRFGHTVRFCAAKREQEMLAKAASTLQKKAQWESGEWMRPGTHQKSEHPGFESPRVTKTKVATPNAPKLAPRFAALDMESDDSSCDECEAPAPEPAPAPAPKPSCVWANVVKMGVAPRAPAVLDSWEDDEELPPLIFGRKFNPTRWGERD
jgi:hypothetical protein